MILQHQDHPFFKITIKIKHELCESHRYLEDMGCLTCYKLLHCQAD